MVKRVFDDPNTTQANRFSHFNRYGRNIDDRENNYETSSRRRLTRYCNESDLRVQGFNRRGE
jgi:hypothetical protein